MKKKVLSFIFLCLIIGSSTYCQKNVPLISEEAFSKMMIDFYNFTIAGSQTPTTGFKVETNKPSITLKGNIYSDNYRSFVTNLELEGGLDNDLMQLVSGKDVSSYFKANVGFNFLRSNNKARYYKVTETERHLTNGAFWNNKFLLSKSVDSFVVIKIITDDQAFSTYNYESLKNAVIEERKDSKYQLTSYTRTYPSNEKDYFNGLIRGILIYYGAKSDSTQNDDTVLSNFRMAVNASNDTSILSKRLLEDYDRLKEGFVKKTNTLNDKHYDFEIDLTKVNWTWKKIKWWNISISAINSNFKLYTTASNSLLDSNSFLPSVSASHNWLWKGKEPNKFAFLKAGASFQKTNSLVDLQKFNYEKETIISVSPGEELKSKKEGVAYLGELVEKNGFDLYVEGYWVPWKSLFIPGFYLKSMYRNSEAWINKEKISLDAGIVWNLSNNDKDAKNILSIVPYFSWSNLLQEYKDVAKTEEKEMSDLFSFNIKFGIPINLGK